MEEYCAKTFETPFRPKDESIGSSFLSTTMDRTYLPNKYEEKRNFNTPKKYHYLKYVNVLKDAPRKNTHFETRLGKELEPLNIELFKEEDLLSYEENACSDFEKISKISGALFYYKMDNFFVFQGFLEWLITFEDIKELLFSEVVGSFLKGFNERSILLYKVFVK